MAITTQGGADIAHVIGLKHAHGVHLMRLAISIYGLLAALPSVTVPDWQRLRPMQVSAVAVKPALVQPGNAATSSDTFARFVFGKSDPNSRVKIGLAIFDVSAAQVRMNLG
jgi:hypothetical protein